MKKVLTAEDCKEFAKQYKEQNNNNDFKLWNLLSKIAITANNKRKEEFEYIQNLTAVELFERANKFYIDGNYKQAFISYWLSAQKGSADSALELAYMYANGEYVFVNYKLSIMWYKISANRGNTEAKKILRELKYQSLN
jgi:TPR repeat protein